MPQDCGWIKRHRRHTGVVGAALIAAVMWHAASKQFTGGLLDLVVFAPPGAALGLVSTWSAYAFAPNRFTWRRGLIGVLVGGVVVSPLIAFLVAFAAAWDPASSQFVFNVGAWVALAGGFGAGGSAWVVEWVREWRRSRAISGGHATPLSTPDVRDGFRPTPRPQAPPLEPAAAFRAGGRHDNRRHQSRKHGSHVANDARRRVSRD